MLIGQRVRSLRRKQQLSLGDIEKRVGLMRTYVSRVERGRTVPSLDTLEKLAFALRLPMYRLFCDGHRPHRNGMRHFRRRPRAVMSAEMRDLARFRRMLPRMAEADRALLLSTAEQMARTWYR
jgi:transcriptional regulator with XRE-family HTH domain